MTSMEYVKLGNMVLTNQGSSAQICSSLANAVNCIHRQGGGGVPTVVTLTGSRPIAAVYALSHPQNRMILCHLQRVCNTIGARCNGTPGNHWVAQ